MRLLFLISFSFISLNLIAQQSKEDKKEARYQAILELIETEQFEFIAQRANPPKVRSIDLTTNPNFLRINQGHGEADIPYFGRSFSGGYSNNDGGIKFDNEIETYDVQKNDKKRKVVIKFVVKGDGDSFRCTLTIPNLDNSSLSVVSNTKQTINYTGYITELKEE